MRRLSDDELAFSGQGPAGWRAAGDLLRQSPCRQNDCLAADFSFQLIPQHTITIHAINEH